MQAGHEALSARFKVLLLLRLLLACGVDTTNLKVPYIHGISSIISVNTGTVGKQVTIRIGQVVSDVNGVLGSGRKIGDQ